MPDNYCDSCNRRIGLYEGAFCGGCLDDIQNRAERRGWWG